MQPHAATLQVWLTVLQHWPAWQSELVQQPEMQLPLQHTWPPPHWLVLVQPHASALQVWLAVSQHWPPAQSEVVQHVPTTQYFAAPGGPESGFDGLGQPSATTARVRTHAIVDPHERRVSAGPAAPAVDVGLRAHAEALTFVELVALTTTIVPFSLGVRLAL